MINVSFTDCACVGNAGGGFQVYLGTYNASAKPFSVLLTNMQLNGGGSFGFGFGGIHDGVLGSIVVRDSIVDSSPGSAVLIFRQKGITSSATFKRCKFTGSCGTVPSCSPISLAMTLAPGATKLAPGTAGNVTFEDCILVDAIDRPFLDATPGFADVTATNLVVQNPHGCTSAGLKIPAQCQSGSGFA
jgi:hypothetical protein